MIDQFLTYELKVAVLIAVFYIFWRLLVANETWHRLNRIVLITTAIASFVLPLCVITFQKTVVVEPMRVVVDKPELVITEIESTNGLGSVDEPSQAFNWQQVLMLIYIIGAPVFNLAHGNLYIPANLAICAPVAVGNGKGRAVHSCHKSRMP